MQISAYDILRKDGHAAVRVESAYDFDAAKSRIERLAIQSSNAYVVFDQRARQIVARVLTPTSESASSSPHGDSIGVQTRP